MPGEDIVAVPVNIFDERYTLHGKDPLLMGRLARFVDTKMREVAEKLPTAQYQKLAVLTALNIAAELFKLRDEQGQLDAALDQLDATSQEVLMLFHGDDPDSTGSSSSR